MPDRDPYSICASVGAGSVIGRFHQPELRQHEALADRFEYHLDSLADAFDVRLTVDEVGRQQQTRLLIELDRDAVVWNDLVESHHKGLVQDGVPVDRSTAGNLLPGEIGSAASRALRERGMVVETTEGAPLDGQSMLAGRLPERLRQPDGRRHWPRGASFGTS